eukprot:7376818-Prymnesium_polylepis.1
MVRGACGREPSRESERRMQQALGEIQQDEDRQRRRGWNAGERHVTSLVARCHTDPAQCSTVQTIAALKRPGQKLGNNLLGCL